MARLLKSDTRLETVTRRVTLEGTKPIMFDRYPGDNNTQLAWNQKIYLNGNVLIMPTMNIVSFLSAHNTNSAPKRLRDSRQFKKICNAILSFVDIDAVEKPFDKIPFLRNGKPITVGAFNEDEDPESGLFLDRRVARLDKGIPNPKERPVLPLPWSLEFDLTIRPTNEIKEAEIYNLIVEGGEAIGFGTFRGVFGKFKVTGWQ